MNTLPTQVIREITNQTIEIPANTALTIVAIAKEGWDGQRTINFDFTGENSTLHFFAYTIGKNSDNFTLRTNSNHHKGHTNAYYTVRSVLNDKSQVDYTGQLNIHPHAQVIDTHLGHHTLLLSRNAKVKTTPSLEIEADDVKAGHAASVGSLDEDLLFYLKSRGIDQATARTLLIRGFLTTDLKHLDDHALREKLEAELVSLSQ